MFVHLRQHTEFSVVDGTLRIDDVVASAAADGQPALGITDLSNMFGAIKFYKAARGAGIKPVLGAEVFVQGLGGAEAPLPGQPVPPNAAPVAATGTRVPMECGSFAAPVTPAAAKAVQP